MISFTYLIPTDYPLTIFHKQWLKEVIRQEQLFPGEISYTFCTDEYLLERNIAFLSHDTLTDIITFDNRVGDCVSGEIFISVDRVQENATTMGLEYTTELLRVLVHGVLHLCGYKDKTPIEEQCMRGLEDKYIALFYNKFNA